MTDTQKEVATSEVAANYDEDSVGTSIISQVITETRAALGRVHIGASVMITKAVCVPNTSLTAATATASFKATEKTDIVCRKVLIAQTRFIYDRIVVIYQYSRYAPRVQPAVVQVWSRLCGAGRTATARFQGRRSRTSFLPRLPLGLLTQIGGRAREALCSDLFPKHDEPAGERRICVSTAGGSLLFSGVWHAPICARMATAETKHTRVFGVDFGTQRSVVAESNGDVVLNELGSMTTATLVSFKGDERLIGESAVLSSSTNPRNTVDCLNLLLGKDFAQVQAITSQLPGQRVAFEQAEGGQVLAQVEYQNDSKKFSLEQLTGMLFGKLADQMKKRVRADDGEAIHVIVAVPSAWTQSEKTALALASKIAGIPRISFITRDAALARCFIRKHPLEQAAEDAAEPVSKHIAIVDIGHATTSVSVVKLTNDGETVLASESDLSLGADSFDRQLFYHFQKEVLEKHQLSVSLPTKEGKRLFQACEKLKKLLSTIGEAAVTVENIAQDRDISIKISRDVFEQLCAAESERVTQLVASALAKSQVSVADITSVEIVGGGTRIPFVQAAILKAFGTDLQRGSGLLGRMLDSTTAIAVGAAFSSDAIDASGDEELKLSEAQQAQQEMFVALEEQMRSRDVELAAIANERNAIEAFVYEMRSKASEKHGAKLESAKLNPLLDEAEDWIYSEESEFASLAAIQAKRQEIETQIREVCSAYFEAVDADEKAFEAHLEEESKKAEAERSADGNDEDHDTRKLKKPERMRLVVKNKEEGNELFRDGNYQHAAMRYVKALSHSSKFFDLNDNDLEEVNKLKLSLYLNLAQCYLKLESWGKAIANCKDALALDPLNAKALYRRALAYEKEKSIDLAAEDVKAALKVSPEDKAILKLDERIKLVQKRQLDKEKKMWSKAFA